MNSPGHVRKKERLQARRSELEGEERGGEERGDHEGRRPAGDRDAPAARAGSSMTRPSGGSDRSHRAISVSVESGATAPRVARFDASRVGSARRGANRAPHRVRRVRAVEGYIAEMDLIEFGG